MTGDDATLERYELPHGLDATNIPHKPPAAPPLPVRPAHDDPPPWMTPDIFDQLKETP